MSCEDNYEFEEVLPDYLLEDPEFATFYSVKLPSYIANDFLKLSSSDDFTSRYPHIKRMRRVQDSLYTGDEKKKAVEMLIGEKPELSSVQEEFLAKNDVELIRSKHIIPRTPPYCKKKYFELSKVWPLNYLKPKWNLEVLPDDIKYRASRYINLAIRIGREFNGRGCVIELNGKIAATGADMSDVSYPWMHSFISAVNNFSNRLVNCGYRQKGRNVKDLIDDKALKSAFNELKEEESKSELAELGPGFEHINKGDTIQSSELKDQYLCTNCVVYLSHEPCISCSMALVHSRVSKVFYLNRDKERGFLGSKHKLHCVPELNHHYRVFRHEEQKHKLKRLIQSPNSFFMDVRCPGCLQITTVFSHAQTVVFCGSCSAPLCQPTGGRCKLTDGCSFRRKND
ncbi:hypothetical protein RS030_6889 [Cryptosporidium xiaoi]|uniref:40S ribosomal protein S27 n=1 Tax=Cryptosporidium xiaoi TaxID=659607 RepID=A0AAV9XUA2_9CRYT